MARPFRPIRKEPSGSARQLVFLCGLHRSGTSLLFRCLRQHPQISGFANTGVPEDEGQHLQSVYPPAKAHGGPGRFGFDPAAYLDESSELVTEENRRKLFGEWVSYWDLDRPLLLEKSPPNLIRTRFLQALFPESSFIVLLRHPIAVALATQKFSGTSLNSLIAHWLICHERSAADWSRLDRLRVVTYEDLVANPGPTLRTVCEFLDLPEIEPVERIDPNLNEMYLRQWKKMLGSLRPARFSASRIVRRFEDRLARFGYSLRDPDSLGEFQDGIGPRGSAGASSQLNSSPNSSPSDSL